MWQSAHDSYLESKILSADPIELTRMLYDAALGAVRDARSRLAAGEIAARAKSISKASAIVIELTTSLDFERGGKISTDLARLYDYILRKLTEANLKQSDALLAEVLGLLTTLSEGWEGVKAQVGTIEHHREEVVATPARPESSWSQPAAAEESATTYGNWSQPAASEPATSYGNSWSQPAASGPVTSYGNNSWSQPAAFEPVTSYGNNSWSQPAASEPVTNYSSSWAEPSAKEPAPIDWAQPVADRGAAYGNAWSPAPQEEIQSTGNSWETSSPAPASPYGNAWVPAEPPASYSSHDWSL